MGRWTELLAIQGPRGMIYWEATYRTSVSRETKDRPAALTGTSGPSCPVTMTYVPFSVSNESGADPTSRGHCRSGKDGASGCFGLCVLCLLSMEYRTEPRTGNGLFFLINGLNRYWVDQ